MACDLTTGRTRACYDSVAGIKAVYFADYGSLGAITYDLTNTDVITTFAGTPEFFQYDLKGNANTYTEVVNKVVDNGTAAFTQTLQFTLPKLTKSASKELKLLMYGSPHVIVEDYNGNLLVMGLINGADITGGGLATGGARSDLSGWTITMTGEEQKSANFLDDTIVATTATISAVQESP